MPAELRFAAYPSVKLLDDGGKEIHHLLWGDWVQLLGEERDGLLKVHARGKDGWLRPQDLQEERLLELIFVDVGQGDGCLLITPDDRHLLIDAGEKTNLYRFARWRYGGFRNRWTFHAAVITHPDQDHYRGFQPFFEDANVSFDHVYLSGILEQRGDDPLGHVAVDGQQGYLDDLLVDRAAVQAFLADTSRWQGTNGISNAKRYPLLLHTAETSGRVGDIRMLSTLHGDGGWVPGFGADRDLRLRVLSPVVEPGADGRARLRCFGPKPGPARTPDTGKTKNGHSVVLRLEYGDLRVLLGGDLNSSAETFLLEHSTGLGGEALTPGERQQRIEGARATFGVDIAKCCHHGSQDFTDDFLAAVGASATVISSGDEESHAHPRCDTLGAIGLHGRGARPLIFSTELARSTREDEGDAREKIGRLDERIARADDPAEKADLEAKKSALVDQLLKRNVTTYGAINLRSDGNRVVLAYRLERDRAGFDFNLHRSTVTRWDLYPMERVGGGPLMFVKR